MVLDWVKFLRKQDINISIKIYEVIEQILSWNFDWLDIKPLKWRYWFYRCRIWNIRIVFINMKWSISVYKIWTRWDIYKWL
jgi:hypothetical protein